MRKQRVNTILRNGLLLSAAISDLVPLNSSTMLLKLIEKKLIGMINTQLTVHIRPLNVDHYLALYIVK